MAKPSHRSATPVSAAYFTSGHSDPADDRLRALKNRLQARFPDVRSSHLTEAMAAGLGFNTQAALLATKSQRVHTLAYRAFQAKPFKLRLLELGYPVQPDFRFGPPSESPTPPTHYLEWLAELSRLWKTPDRVWPRIHALRHQCADEFARKFGLGHSEARDDKRVVKRWSVGVDHSFGLPGWGDNFNAQRGAYVSFPGSDHVLNFYESLPVAGATKPKSAEYCSAVVSMPYFGASGQPAELEEAAHRAGRIGWTCSLHNEWSWYAPGATALVLFRPLTSAAELRKAWTRSFKRWLLENRTRLSRSSKQWKPYTVDDAIDTPHLPLDLKDYEDLRERYLREFAFELYMDREAIASRHLENLMAKWALECPQEVQT